MIGRIICLTVSIITINCDKGRGVLKGTKWLKKWFVFLRRPKIINPSQKGNTKDKLSIIWAVIVKTKGINLLIFISKIKKKNVNIILSLPLLNLFVIALLISLSTDLKTNKFIFLLRELIKKIYSIIRGLIRRLNIGI